MFAILINPLNKPYMICDHKGEIIKFESEDIAKGEAEKYIHNNHCFNKLYVVINLDNYIHAGGRSEIKKEIAALTFDLINKGFLASFFICGKGCQGSVVDEQHKENSNAQLKLDDHSLGVLIEYRDQLKNLLNNAG